MAMWAEIATPEQAKEIVRIHFHDTCSFNAPAGIRTLSPLEKMYNVRASGNPSSWQGPVWINVNYPGLSWIGEIWIYGRGPGIGGKDHFAFGT